MVSKLAQLLETITGWVLAGIAVSAQFGNVIACIIFILFGAGVFFKA